MTTTGRTLLVAAGAGLAMTEPAAQTRQDSRADEVAAALLQRSAEANAALMRGDVERYRALMPLAADFTLMSPFGGTPTHGGNLTEEHWAAIGRFFQNGTLRQDLVQAYASADMVVLVIIEYSHVEAGGLPAQDWPLRVTLVYRREGAEWQLAHRHADPLGKGISVEQAAALARGDAK